MRILITSSPGIGHFFPLITTAWALRSAGHEVILATPSNSQIAEHAGLSVVDPAPGFDFPGLFRRFMGEYPQPTDMSDGRPTDEWQAGLRFAGKLFAAVSEPAVDETVRLAQDWRPELIVHGPLNGAGPLAAAVIGVPAIAHGIAPGQGAELWQAVAEEMSESYQRFGVTPVPQAAFLDVSPPSMRPPNSTGLSLRYVPYNGGGLLPTWLTTPRQRARITVTLGSVLPRMAGLGALGQLVSVAGAVDAEFVFALGGGDLSALGPLPANVRVVDWTPLHALLNVSDAVVHHGGAGTTMTALVTATRQLVLPQGADQYLNAAMVARAGAGAVVKPADLDADRLRGLLADSATADAATAVATEIAGQPSPAEVVPAILDLAG
ncbi:MAG TPA: nucleotide disphospho-sugar-binding domain-containing protein [Pseudonocardiaceae bacterium]|nr:nucleotide disphospho-sugar-binding domain-containing protein [Pseudonocardiaceae bacterium]